MIEEFEFETYLRISKSFFGIYLFDKRNLVNLYENEQKFDNNNFDLDLNVLSKFLENNIFKIEKLIGKFIQNITLIIDNKNFFFVDIGIKKKSYKQQINKIYLENLLTEAKDIIKETNQKHKIIHMLIKKYRIDGINYSNYSENNDCENLCLEIKFISLPNNFTSEIEKILEKYQIKASKYLDYNYINNFFINDKFKVSEMAYKIQNGLNENEVQIIPKNLKKMGFFEKFFHLFS